MSNPPSSRAMGATLQLVTASTILAIVLGILVGIISALRQYSAIDYSFTVLYWVLLVAIGVAALLA